MNERDLRRALLGAPPPDEVGAQRRAWRVVRAAFDEREPSPWPQRNARPLVAAAAVVAILAAILSPQGRAVIGDVRDALGTERVVGVRPARPALFSLPAEGRLLVSGPTGAWIVAADGAKRRLGSYRQASWSPRGLHAVVTKRSQVVAVTPKGAVRWSLPRPRVRHARWSPSGFRVAYLSGSNLRVVAGDGTADRRLGAAHVVAPAWRPGADHVFAYVDRGRGLTLIDTDSRRMRWRTPLRGRPLALEWSSDAARLLVASSLGVGRFSLSVYDPRGRRVQSLAFAGSFVGAAFAPREHDVALVRRLRAATGAKSELLVVDANVLRRQEPVFEGAGRFSDVAWSPGGRWLLLGWESADQWLFIRSTDVEKIKAVSSLSKQFDPSGTGARGFPSIEGWCCAEPQ